MGYTPRSVWLKTIAVVAGASLVLTACGSSDSSTTTTSSGSAGAPAATGASSSGSSGSDGSGSASASSDETSDVAASSGIVIANSTEPQNPLIPTNTNEVGGGRIVDLLFAGLVYYDAAGAPQNEMAESISSTDGQTFTVKLKTGWTFTNGDPITAKNFVDTWNYGALGTNAQLSAIFFEPIEGYDEVTACTEGAGPPDDDGAATCLPAPTAQTMSGLTVVSDTEFTIKLKQPQSDFPLALGYSAFLPLPAGALADPQTYGETPVGNGPYMLETWEHNASIKLVPNPDYKGGRTPKNGGIQFNFYESFDAAYADLLSNNLDVLDNIPPSSLTSFEADLGDRAINKPVAVFQSFTIPQNLPHFGGEEGNLRRQAMSMAINRDEITSVIFNGTRTPAKDFSSPTIAGYKEGLVGSEVLTYNEAQAKALWAQADAIAPWSGTFTIGYNSDGGHKEWVDATTNSIKNVLGIEASGNPFASFAELRTEVTNRTITGAFRSGWQADYPSIYNFLAPLYVTGAGSNDGDYSNPAFDTLITEGAGAADVESGIAKFQAAQEILFQDLPAIPLWYSNVTGGYSENVANVQFDWHSVPLYHAVTKES